MGNGKNALAKRRLKLRREERNRDFPERLQNLDALRGIAALVVVFSHLFDIGVYRQVTPCQWLFWYAGHQAVILFFVLSGFVLSIPYHEGRALPYHLFAGRRVMRIWMPYAVVVGLTFFWRMWSQENSVPAIPLDPTWQTPLTWHLLFSHLLLIGNIDYEALVPSAWTLVHEMRISLLFPLIFWMCVRLPWPLGLLLAVLISLGANFNYTLLCGHAWVTAYVPFETIHFTAMFMIGILLARYRHGLVGWEQGLLKTKLALFYAVTFMLYVFPFYNAFSESQRMLGDLPTTLGSAGLIILALSSGQRFFGHGGPVFLGRVSYSLYLVHLPIMLILANAFFSILPTAFLYIVILGTVWLGTLLFWYGVERHTLVWCREIGRRRQ